MHRDKKLGLALALMVIGFGTALCFKQDINSYTNSPALESSDKLDEEIATRKSQPYLFKSGRGDDDDDLNHFKVTKSPSANSSSNERGSNSSRFSNPFNHSEKSDDFDTQSVTLKKPEASGRDLADSKSLETEAVVKNRTYNVPDHNAAWESTEVEKAFDNSTAGEIVAKKTEEPAANSTTVTLKKPFTDEAHFTSFPELLGEKSSNTQTDNNEIGATRLKQPVSTNGLTLQKPIVSLDDQIDPFAEEEVSSVKIESKSAPKSGLNSWGKQLQTPVATEAKSSPTLQKEISAQTMLIHEVRRAETLSGLSARYLGSATKFMQIYDANRDVLKSPHDIRVGMKLRIPKQQGAGVQASKQFAPRASHQTAPAKHRVSQYRQQEEVDLLPEPKKEPRQIIPNEELFTPVRRSPFNN